jgi:hypothetical protein
MAGFKIAPTTAKQEFLFNAWNPEFQNAFCNAFNSVIFSPYLLLAYILLDRFFIKRLMHL